MLQLFKDNFHPLSISNTFTTLLALLNATQGDKEGLHEFHARFEGHVSTLSQSSMVIPLILQVMLFFQALHSCYQDLLAHMRPKRRTYPVQRSISWWLMLSLWRSSSWWASNPSWGLQAHLLALWLPLRLSLIRMARSIALPGSGLLRLTQLLLSPAGVDLSRAAFVVLFVTHKKSTILTNVHSLKNWASNPSKLAVRVVVNNWVVALLQTLLLNFLWQLPLRRRQRPLVILPPQPLDWLPLWRV
jgi:hypothetical protein